MKPEKPETLAALADIARGEPVAAMARKHGVRPSTLFRALKRRKEGRTEAAEKARQERAQLAALPNP